MIKRNSSLILLISCLWLCAQGQVNDKFIKAATKEVWNLELPAFDPKTVIPDSIADGQSAVIIADNVLIKGVFDQNTSYSKAYNIGNIYTSLTSLRTIRRRMVKLLDESAVERFSSVDIGSANKVKLNNYNIAKREEAFGARVYKPNGDVVVVDVSQGLKVGSGKDGKKEESRRLQVPGLAVGDVLEYFTYNLDEIDELSLPPFKVNIFQDYPIMNFELNGIFSPELTVEYCTVNGAPLLGTSFDDKGNCTASISFTNLPAIRSTKFFMHNRQMPYYRFAVLNNNSTMVWHPKLARKGGLYPNIVPATYYREIGEALLRFQIDEGYVKQPEKYMKAYMKAHPDTDKRDLIDRAWVATLYYFLTAKKVSTGDMTISLTFRELMRKLKLDDEKTGIAIVNSRLSFPTECLLGYVDVDYMPVVNGVAYCATTFDECAPGEFPAHYQGESGAVYYDDFKKTSVSFPETFTLPTVGFNGSVLYSGIKLAVNVDDEELPIEFERSVMASGAMKGHVGLTVDRSTWAAEVEDYLDIPKADRYKPTDAERRNVDELMESFAMRDCESFMGVRPSKITEKALSNIGCLPSAKKMNYRVSGSVDGLVTDAAGDLVVDIGRFFGKNGKLVGKDRERECDAMLFAPHQYVYSVELKIPDGYKVDPESVLALKSDLKNSVGCFIVNPSVDDQGRLLSLSVIERKLPYVVPLNYWQEFLDLNDAAAAFNETSIVLTPIN